MEDRSAASVGVAVAALALAAAAFPWGTTGVGPFENVVVAVLGGAALGAFSLRRRDLLGRVPGSLAAGVASLGIVGYAAVAVAAPVAGGSALVAEAPSAPSPWGVGLALLGGVGGVVAAYGDGRGFPDSLRRAAKAISWSLAVGYAGLFAIAIWGSLLVGIAGGLMPGEPGSAMELALGAVALGFGTGTVALLYFQWTDKTVSYLDFRTPSLRDVGYVVGGVVALFALQAVVTVVLSELGVRTANHSIQQTAANGDASILLLMIPASWLIVGPGEELLYRNIIQKDLYDTFGDWGAVLVGSAVFSLAHIPAYATGASVGALVSTLAVIFGLSLVLGATYLRTDNLTVPALIHGTFDAVIFGAMYFQLTGGA
ncbi:CPBP family intramembrane metalloprotease [Halorussus limi]|uniref:CPBP family intramembrane metalloprotease n=1 Tax=Halorussus limi TaxID=2938695 RepID=A0A8U0HWW9_9EURY|nr:type II CAAX endopeptidase family protein [Halorussus limi]UPV75273.1 CPBP family intramembrane metalloprotease [Halorussus limi]